MTNELNTTAAAVVAQWESPEVLIARRERMVDLMKKSMQEGRHFGKITGCKQNSLFQPGSQLLSVSFKIGHDPTGMVEDLSTPDEKRYRVTDRVFDQITGMTLGYGIGECSSSEEKYAWKRTYLEEEWGATPMDRRKIKFYKDDRGVVHENKMIRTNPADVANTILKMARKRANVNGTIEVLAASDVFTQDVEDLPSGMDFGEDERAPKSSKPSVTSAQVHVSDAPVQADDGEVKDMIRPTEEQRSAGKLVSEKQAYLMIGECKKAGVEHRSVAKAANVQNVFWLTWQKNSKVNFNVLLELVKTRPNSFAKFSQAAETAQQTTTPVQQQPASDQSVPAVMDAEEFATIIEELAMQAGISVTQGLMECVGVDSPSKVPATSQSKAVDYFTAKAETPAA